MKNRIKVLLGTAMVGVSVVALTPTSAYASARDATAHYATVCNVTNGSVERAWFPYHGATKTPALGYHWCVTLGPVYGLNSDEVVGYRKINGVYEAVAYRYFNDANGVVFEF